MIDSYAVYDWKTDRFLQKDGTFGRGCTARTYGRKSDARNSMNYKGLYNNRYYILRVVGLVAACHDEKDKFMDTTALTAEEAVNMLLQYYHPDDTVLVGTEVEADCRSQNADDVHVVESIRYHNNR